MNERIKQLEAQCWEARQYGPPWFNAEKFAELIIEQCIDIAFREDHDPAECIKKYFGVE